MHFLFFYYPEPAQKRPDDFYGISFGSGIVYKTLFSLDFAYQYRFGKKKNAGYMDNQQISGRVSQHYLYASLIFYIF